jgi:hypothetical protein
MSINWQLIKDNNIKRFWSKIDIKDNNECWPYKEGKTGDKYGGFWLNDRVELAHRFAFAVANNYLGVTSKVFIPEGLIVMHICDNPMCCNPAHLKLGTQEENMHDRNSKGRRGVMSGRYGPRIELSVDEILDYVKQGYTHKQIAKIYGVSRPLITKKIRLHKQGPR